MAEIKLTTSNFQSEVLDSELPVVVDFWATWCGPCQMLGPIIAELAEDFDGKVKVGKVNVDEQMALASKYKISVIPTVMLFKGGEPVKTSVGFFEKAQLVEKLGL